jgi:hypothetical protein
MNTINLNFLKFGVTYFKSVERLGDMSKVSTYI